MVCKYKGHYKARKVLQSTKDEVVKQILQGMVLVLDFIHLKVERC